MKRFKYILTVLAVSTLGLTGCSEDVIELYSGPKAVRVDIDGSDDGVLTHSFGFDNDQNFTYKVELTLSGFNVDYQREFKVELTGTAVEGTDFTMPTTVTLPAGACSVEVDLVLNRPTEEKELIITVVNSGDFVVGNPGTVKVIYNDDVPSEWVSTSWYYNYYLGDPSQTKNLFVHDLTGSADLGSHGWSVFKQFSAYFEGKVAEYNRDPAAFAVKYNIVPADKYGPAPMTDENGELVKFKP